SSVAVSAAFPGLSASGRGSTFFYSFELCYSCRMLPLHMASAVVPLLFGKRHFAALDYGARFAFFSSVSFCEGDAASNRFSRPLLVVIPSTCPLSALSARVLTVQLPSPVSH
ncbi:unnamed protein product, partial [Laminaria digitata]